MKWVKFRDLEIKAKRNSEYKGIAVFSVFIRRQEKTKEFTFYDYSFHLKHKETLTDDDLLFILSSLLEDAIFENKELRKFKDLGLELEDLKEIFEELNEKEGGM